MAERRNYDFGEKLEKWKANKENLEIKESKKYQTSREQAISLIESKKYNLDEGDFWLLSNDNKLYNQKQFTCVCITHEGLLKINKALDESKKFNQKFCSNPIEYEYDGKKSLVMTYRDEVSGMYEVGEVSVNNSKNAYPFAMLSKRIFDRVVKRNADLTGVYSDSEVEEIGEKDLMVDTSTGEVIEEKKGMTIEEALDYKVEASEHWKGKTFRYLINESDPKKETRVRILNMFAKKGTSRDKEAASVVYEALLDGKIILEDTVA